MSEPSGPVELALMRKDLDTLNVDVQALRKDVKDLVDAWKAANNLVAFVKWLSTIATAIGILWAAIKIKLGA
jgi:hypothetical protein